MKKIFFVITPYQLLLSRAIIENYKYKNVHLVIINKENFDFKNIDQTCFNKISILGSSKNNGFISKILKNLKLIYFVCYVYIIRNNYDKLFYSNEKSPYIQGIIRIFSQKGVTINYIEDGANAYCDLRFNYINHKFSLLDKFMLFDRKYEYVECHGELSLSKSVYSLYPEYLRDELKDKNIIKIKKDSLRRVLPNNSMRNNIIILMDMSDSPNAKLFLKLIKFLNNKNINTFIKYHPREKYKYVNVKKLNRPNLISELNNKLSIEEILNGTKSNIIISNYSTSLHTLSLISDNTLISLYEICKNNTQKNDIDLYINMLKKIGVLFPNSMIELENKIRSMSGD